MLSGEEGRSLSRLARMTSPTLIEIAAAVLQLGAAGFMVYRAWQTARGLSGMRVTIDSIGPDIERLGNEMAGQFRDQLIAFAVLAVGTALQLFG